MVSTLTFSLSNNTAGVLSNVGFTDLFPADGTTGGQLIVAAVPNASTSCGGATLTAVPGADSFAISGGVVPGRANGGIGAAGLCTVQVDVVGPAGVYANQVTANGESVAADGTGPIAVAATSNTANLTYISALTVAKQFTPDVVSSAGTSEVLIRLANGGSAELTGAAVTDVLPSGMLVVSGSIPRTTCGGAPVINVTSGGAQVDLSGASVLAGATCDLIFEVQVSGSGPWVNDIPVGAVRADGGVINITSATATLTEQPAQDLFLSKAINPSSLSFPGQTARLTVTVTNGTAAVTAPAGDRFVRLSQVNLAPNQVCTFEVDVTSVAVGGITNIIPIGQATSDQGTSNVNVATSSLTTSSSVGVIKSFSPEVIQPGERSRLLIRLFNATATPVSAIDITDTLPAGMTIPAGADPQTTCGGTLALTGTQIRVTGGTLAATSGSTLSSCDVLVDVTAASAGSLDNVIAANTLSATAGGQSITNAEPASATLLSTLPVQVQVAIDDATLDGAVLPGSGFSTGSATGTRGGAEVMTIRLRNPGVAPLTGLRLEDVLPAGMSLAPTPNGATTCSGASVAAVPSADRLTLTGASLAAGASCDVTVNVLSNASGTYVNDIQPNTLTTNEGASNGQTTLAELIILDPPTVGLAFDLPVIQPNGTSTAVITLGNSNDGPLTLTSPFTYTLPTAPGAINVAGTPNITTTCGGTVTAAAGGTTISYPSGATIPAGGCEIRVDVTGATAGDYTGVIPAGDLVTNAGPNPSVVTAPLAISTQGFVSGRVFGDNDPVADGVFTTGTDTPLGGVSINLHTGGTCAGTPSQTTTTDVQGNYVFSDLAAGTYSICQPGQPANSFNGTPTAGDNVLNGAATGTPGTASNPSGTTSQIAGIVLGSESGNVSGSANNLFAERLESGLSGKVFLDDDNSGVQNGTETGIASQTIELIQGGSVVQTTSTDASGNYGFSDVAPGTYSIRQSDQPADTVNGITTAGTVNNGGTAGTATGAAVTPSIIADIILPPNTTATGNDFAELPTTRRLSGQVFLDTDNDGTLNGSDYGLAGQAITLTGTDVNGNALTRTASTDGNGDFVFTGLPEGTYTITQDAQPGDTTNGQTIPGNAGGTPTAVGVTPSSIAGIDLTGGNRVAGGNSFGEVPVPGPDLTVALTHAPTEVAENNGGATFTATPSNVGSVDSSGTVTVITTLPAGITPTSASGPGYACSISGQVVTCTTPDVIASSGTGNPIIIGAFVADGLAGSVLTADAAVSGGSESATFASNNTDTDTVAIATGAQVSGSIWRDVDHDRVRDIGEAGVQGWTVELLRAQSVVGSDTTDANGQYAIEDIPPGAGYSIRFREPLNGSEFGGARPNEDGMAFVNGSVDPAANPGGADLSDGTLQGLTLVAGENIVEQSLPLDPAGVVYDSATRAPVSGATVTVSGPAGFTAADVVGGSASVITGADGFYQFLFLPSAPAGTYTLAVTNPSSFVPGPSTQIPACTGVLTVGATPDPALVQTQATAPTAGATIHDPATCPATSAGLAAGGGSTQHFFSFNLTPGTSADVLNNHIPLDPVLGDSLVLTKTTPREEVYRGAGVPYTITARNALNVALDDVTLRDTIPPGFVYRPGTAAIDGVLVEPTISGRQLNFAGQDFALGESKTLTLLLTVGAGVGDGEYTNEVVALNALAGGSISNIASATVRIAPDPIFDCSDIIGKVFNDRNGNGIQEAGEEGLSRVVVSTVNGLLITTDDFGRYHVPCAAIPDAFNGSNFIMKLDESTLPFGFMMTSENPEVVRVTRGKLVKLNFGAAVYQLAKIDLTSAAFAGNAPSDAVARAIRNLPETFSKKPTIVQFIHHGTTAAKPRLRQLRRMMERAWDRDGCCYPLKIETHVAHPGGTIEEFE